MGHTATSDSSAPHYGPSVQKTSSAPLKRYRVRIGLMRVYQQDLRGAWSDTFGGPVRDVYAITLAVDWIEALAKCESGDVVREPAWARMGREDGTLDTFQVHRIRDRP